MDQFKELANRREVHLIYFIYNYFSSPFLSFSGVHYSVPAIILSLFWVKKEKEWERDISLPTPHHSTPLHSTPLVLFNCDSLKLTFTLFIFHDVINSNPPKAFLDFPLNLHLIILLWLHTSFHRMCLQIVYGHDKILSPFFTNSCFGCGPTHYLGPRLGPICKQRIDIGYFPMFCFCLPNPSTRSRCI